MLLQGLSLTIVGMSVVFVFLTLLVIVMKLMSAFIPKYFPDITLSKQGKTRQAKKESVAVIQETDNSVSETVPMGESEIAAVIAAVTSYSHSWKG